MIAVVKTEMGGIFKKLCYTSDNDDDSDYYDIESPEEFYRYLRLELKDDEINCLKYLFYSIKVAEQQFGRDFYKMVTTKKFRKKFKYELDHHRSRIHTDKNLQGCLMDHCFAIIWVHLDILKSMNSALAIHNLLYEVAACHIHFKDFSELLNMHDTLLYKFIKIEFNKYTNKFTLQALEKYLEVISYRIMQLKEDMEEKERDSEVVMAAKKQRTSLELRIKELNNLRQIYSGVCIETSSNNLVLPEPFIKSTTNMAKNLTIPQVSEEPSTSNSVPEFEN